MSRTLLLITVLLSLLLQAVAAVLALRLIKVTSRYRAWLLVVAALSFMALRRFLVLGNLLLAGAPDVKAVLHEELVALATSALMAAGIYFVRPVFLSLKQSEEALRAAERRYRSIFEKSLDGIVVSSRDGQILDMNPSALRSLGYEAQEVKGLNIAEIYADPSQRALFQEEVESRGWVREYGMVLRRKNGGELHFEVSASLNLAADGTILGYQGILRDVTARKQMQEALQLSEKKFANVFNSSPIWMILSTQTEGRLVEVNEAFLTATGFNRQEVLGRTSLELGLWADPRDRELGIQEIESRGHLRNLEVRRRTRQGQSLVMLWSADRIDLGGEDVLLSVYLDITERQRAEAALRESEARHRLLLEASPDPIVVYDMEGRVSYLNSAFGEVFGWTASELLGRTIPYVPQEEQAKVDGAIEQVRSGQKAQAFNTRRITKTGQALDIQLSASCFCDAHGTPLGHIVILRDVTKQNLAQAALRSSEEKYRLVVDNADEAIFIAQDGLIKFPNPRASDLSGRTEEELTQSPIISLVHPQDQDFAKQLQASVRSGQPFSVSRPFRMMTKSGQLRWLSASGIPINWEGRPAALVFVRDMTEHKRMEQQLMHAQKMEAIGRLAGGVAHDFNNLLMIIKGYGELALKETPDDHHLRSRLLRITQAGEKGISLTRGLLSLSHQLPTSQEVINLNQLVSGMGELFRPLIPENVKLSTILCDDIWPVLGEVGQLEQVIMNLVVNALDAMPQGGNLIIETCNKEIIGDQLNQLIELKPGSYAHIAVTDTGCGIDPQTLSHIFEPFYTTKGYGKGTGLGLSVVYGILKQSGGGLSVYSEPGRGTTFKVYLPREHGPMSPRQPSHPSGEAAVQGWETVLLVEDEEAVRSLIAEALRLDGYQVLEAGQAREALEVAAAHTDPLHLIVSDVVLPDMSGPQMVERLTSQRGESRVLFISGYTEAAVSQLLQRQTNMPFLQKPFSISELLHKIRQTLT